MMTRLAAGDGQQWKVKDAQMATDPSHEYLATPVPMIRCLGCQKDLPPDARFCVRCGRAQVPTQLPLPPQRHRVIEQGQMVLPGDAPSYPVPPAKLTFVERSATPLPPAQMDTRSRPLGGRFAVRPRPLSDETAALFGKLRQEQAAGHGMFHPSGPLPPAPEFQPPSGLATPAVSAGSDVLPAWLSPALTSSGKMRTADPVTPDFLMDREGERKSGPAPLRLPQSDDLAWPSEPTLRRVPVPPVEGYGPQPDGKTLCTRCWGHKLSVNQKGLLDTCAACGGQGRVPAPDAIPQPMPAADITGPTLLEIEAVKVDMPAQTPQITEPMDGIVEETEGPRRHVQDMVAEIAECMTGVGVQTNNCATRLDRQRERLQDMLHRLEWMDSGEKLVLGMTEDAAHKAVTYLKKAEAAAKEAGMHLSNVEMALDVGLLHVTAWQDTWSKEED